MVKLAVAIVVAGGVQKIDTSSTRVRGESHLLLVGDQGEGGMGLLVETCGEPLTFCWVLFKQTTL